MANLSLLTQIVADEALEAELATAAALDHLRAALADGVFTPEEAETAVEMIEVALREAREAKSVSDLAHSRQRFVDTLMRENEDTLLDGPEWSPYRQRLARAAGFRVVETPDNVIAFPQQSETPAAG